MKKVFISFIFILIVGSAFGQKRVSQLIFNGGPQRTGMYEDVWIDPIICFEGCVPLRQSSGYSYDINVLYQVYSKKTKLSFVYGLGINQKSWGELWFSSGSGPNSNLLSNRNDLTYLGLFYGVNYDFPIGKKTKIIARSLLTPELILNKNDNESLNSLAASLRVTLGLEYQAFENLAFQLTPYFQTAVMNYGKTSYISGGFNSQNFIPYSFGVNLGIVLN
jgi:hypothetical protein